MILELFIERVDPPGKPDDRITPGLLGKARPDEIFASELEEPGHEGMHPGSRICGYVHTFGTPSIVKSHIPSQKAIA